MVKQERARGWRGLAPYAVVVLAAAVLLFGLAGGRDEPVEPAVGRDAGEAPVRPRAARSRPAEAATEAAPEAPAPPATVESPPHPVVRGRVLAADGRPIAGAQVRVADDRRSEIGRGIADAEGRFDVTPSAAPRIVAAVADGFVAARVDLPAVPQPIDIVLQREVQVVVQVEDGDGRPAPGVPVSVNIQDPRFHRRTITDAQGTARFPTGIPVAARMTIEAADDSGARRARGTFEAGADAVVRLRLGATRTLSVTLENAPPTPANAATLVYTRATGGTGSALWPGGTVADVALPGDAVGILISAAGWRSNQVPIARDTQRVTVRPSAPQSVRRVVMGKGAGIVAIEVIRLDAEGMALVSREYVAVAPDLETFDLALFAEERTAIVVRTRGRQTAQVRWVSAADSDIRLDEPAVLLPARVRIAGERASLPNDAFVEFTPVPRLPLADDAPLRWDLAEAEAGVPRLAADRRWRAELRSKEALVDTAEAGAGSAELEFVFRTDAARTLAFDAAGARTGQTARLYAFPSMAELGSAAVSGGRFSCSASAQAHLLVILEEGMWLVAPTAAASAASGAVTLELPNRRDVSVVGSAQSAFFLIRDAETSPGVRCIASVPEGGSVRVPSGRYTVVRWSRRESGVGRRDLTPATGEQLAADLLPDGTGRVVSENSASTARVRIDGDGGSSWIPVIPPAAARRIVAYDGVELRLGD
jgi:hypothetical protein